MTRGRGRDTPLHGDASLAGRRCGRITRTVAGNSTRSGDPRRAGFRNHWALWRYTEPSRAWDHGRGKNNTRRSTVARSWSVLVAELLHLRDPTFNFRAVFGSYTFLREKVISQIAKCWFRPLQIVVASSCIAGEDRKIRMFGAEMRENIGGFLVFSALVQALGFLKISGCLIVQSRG